MIQTILIVLVAVVVLIVIIAVLALRYLRADDSDSFDDIPDEPRPARRPADQDRQRPPAPERRPREPVTEAWAADRPARTPGPRASAGFRDRDSGARPTGSQRAASQAAARREPVGSRAARAAARQDGPDAATSSWDSLSDVDYWAELAADKPEITPATSGLAATARHGGEPPSDIRPAASRPAARGESGLLPARERHQPSRPSQPSRPVGAPSARTTDSGHTEQLDIRAPQSPTTRFTGDAAASSPDVLGRHSQSRPVTSQPPAAPETQQGRQHRHHRSSGAQRPASPRQPQPTPPAQPTYPSRPPAPVASPYPNANGNGNGRGPADNDPLTSPSFPAINTSDSRSYRTRRSAGAGQPGTSGQHARPASDQGATSHQYIEYSSAPRRTTSQPNGYPVQPAALPAGTPDQPAAQAAGHQSPAAPAANPYGSYVSHPQPAHSETGQPQARRSSSGYPETPAPSLAAAAYSGYAGGPGSADWYATPAMASGSSHIAAQPLGQPADGYLPAAGLGGNGNGGSHIRNGSSGRGYAGIDYSSLRYDDPVYPDAQGGLPGYSAGRSAAPYDQQGYGSQDTSGQDGYRSYPGHGTGGR